jgi:adenosine deaminase
LEYGIRATINTDNPNISLTNLSREYELAQQEMQLSSAQIARTLLYAAQGAFASQELKHQLIQKIQTELEMILSKP